MAKKKHSRRQFARNMALSALGFGLATLVIHEQCKHVPYQRFYETHFQGQRGREFTHSEFIQETTPSDAVRASFEQQFEKMRSLFKTPTPVTYFEGKRFTEFPKSETTLREFEQRTKNVTQQFFSWLGVHGELPRLEFHRLTPLTLISKAQNVLHCYVAGIMEEGTIARYHGTFTGGKKGEATIAFMKRSSGELKSLDQMFFISKDVGFKFVREGARTALFAAATDPVLSYTSVPAEALHYLVLGVRRDHAIEDLNAWYKQNGKPEKVTKEQIGVFLQEWVYREEGVVHALLNTFLERQQRKEKFNREDLSSYFNMNAFPPYHYVPRLHALLKTTTPARLLQEYRTNPRALFAKLQP